MKVPKNCVWWVGVDVERYFSVSLGQSKQLYKLLLLREFSYGLRDWQPCSCHFLFQAHKDALLIEADAVDFSILL